MGTLFFQCFISINFSVYILREREHALFQRRGDDLVYKAKIPLGQALVGCAVEVATLDGRLLTIPINDIGKPFHKPIFQPSSSSPDVYKDSLRRRNANHGRGRQNRQPHYRVRHHLPREALSTRKSTDQRRPPLEKPPAQLAH